MTDLTQYIESHEEAKNKNNPFYNGTNLTAMEHHYGNSSGISSF